MMATQHTENLRAYYLSPQVPVINTRRFPDTALELRKFVRGCVASQRHIWTEAQPLTPPSHCPVPPRSPSTWSLPDPPACSSLPPPPIPSWGPYCILRSRCWLGTTASERPLYLQSSVLLGVSVSDTVTSCLTPSVR